METDYKDKSPVRSTTHGQVRGALKKSIYDELYYTFDGIPYAQPPLGELRFKEPQDVQPWNGILDCTEPKDKCLQYNRFSKKISGSEDCLHLNIAAKKLHSEKPLPVMVYIFGGRFVAGDPTSRAWSPDYLMREDVIYISIGYRLGAFGFMSFADSSLGIPGNAGLKDIVLALKWIKANIKYFNGDDKNITLFGHCAGSMLVHLLSVTPKTEGLFHKFILMAGFMHEMMRMPNIEYRLAKKLGYQGENIDSKVYEFIKNIDPKTLVATNMLTKLESSVGVFFTTCTPIIEPYETPAGLIYSEPRELQAKAWTNQIPLMLGITSNDGFKIPLQFLNIMKRNPELMLPQTLYFHPDIELRSKMTREFVKYIAHVESADMTEEDLQRIVDARTLYMVHHQKRMVEARLAYSKAETYLYRFDLDSPDFNFYRIRNNGPGTRGVDHSDELCYLFKVPPAFKLDKTRVEYSTICRMTAMFVEFALRSDPNAPLTRPLVDWKPISKEGPTMCLNISENLEFLPQPEQDKLEIFDRLFKEAGAPWEKSTNSAHKL